MISSRRCAHSSRSDCPGISGEKVERFLTLGKADYLRWQDILAEKGWLVHSWPVEHGGTGWSPVQRYIFEEEMGRANAPRIVPFGPKMVGPVICTFGSGDAEGEIPAGHREERDVVVPGLFGTGRRLRSRESAHAGGP